MELIRLSPFGLRRFASYRSAFRSGLLETRMREFFRSNWASIRTGLLYGLLFYLLYWLGVGIGMAGEWWGNFALGH